MSYEFAKYEKRGHIAYVTINRPEVLNSLHAAAGAELSEIWDDFTEDADAWIAILTGEGRAFCAGNDLKATAAASRGQAAATQRNRANTGFGGITNRFDLFKPVIAAVNGYAMGGGFEMALASDIIIAAEEARFGLPEPRVGLIAGAGGVHRLPRQIPLKTAMGMMLTAKPIDAQEAYRLGLVNEVVPLEQLTDGRALGQRDPRVRSARRPRLERGGDDRARPRRPSRGSDRRHLRERAGAHELGGPPRRPAGLRRQALSRVDREADREQRLGRSAYTSASATGRPSDHERQTASTNCM